MEQVLLTISLENLEARIKANVREAILELQDNTPRKEYLRVNDICEMLSISKASVYGLVAEQKIPHTKRGKYLIFIKNEIDAWIRQDEKLKE